MSPIIRECERRKIDYFILHTGQHYTKELDEAIFSDLELSQPKYNLGIGSLPYRKQLSLMIKQIEETLKKESVDFVLVQGDTTSVLAGALAANKLSIKLGHHEAGLRSHDITMLEEINRIIVDQISDLLFAPTLYALNNLYEEGKDKNKIYLTGNTIVDALLQNVEIANKKTDILSNLLLKEKSYALVTAHRAENVDKKDRLYNILKAISQIKEKFSLDVIFPMHPRTRKRIEEFSLSIPETIKIIEPLGFLEFLQLEKNARIILTDSGGVQEESFILNIPCITLRDNTERPETVEYGWNIIAGTSPKKVLSALKTLLNKRLILPKENSFGDGKAAERIISKILELHK